MAELRACAPAKPNLQPASSLTAREPGPRRFAPFRLPTRPVKGQMLCVVMPQKELVRHVIRTPAVYLIPRSDGRMLIGATQEEAGFRQANRPRDHSEIATVCAESGATTGRRALSRSMGRTPAWNAGWVADSRRDGHARLFCCEWTFSGRHSAGAGHGAGYGTGDYGEESRVRLAGIWG